MAFGTRVFGVGKFLLVVGALAATFALSFLVAMRVAVRARDVVVPDLTGRTINDASTLLTEAGLTLREEGRRVDEHVRPDHIAGQDPAPGTATRPPRQVRVWVSAGTRASVVASVVGEPERSAVARLQTDGVTVAESAEVRSSAFPAGTVVAQSVRSAGPAAGVTLLVNRGEEGAGFVMPDLIGVSGDRAVSFLRTQGFRVTLVPGPPYPGVPSGTILRHSPRAGFRVAAGDTISLETAS